MIRLHKTQYTGLKYGHVKGSNPFWTYYDCHDPRLGPAPVGLHYASREELLADLHRYARQWGHYTPVQCEINVPAARLRMMDDCHTEGWACLFLGPDELQGADISAIENVMLEAAWAYINAQKEI